jgi:hypothetical protein
MTLRNATDDPEYWRNRLSIAQDYEKARPAGRATCCETALALYALPPFPADLVCRDDADLWTVNDRNLPSASAF